MRLLLISALIMGFLTPTFAATEDDTKMKIVLASMVAASTADLITTYQAIDRGAIEGNPLMGQDKFRIAVVKATTTSLTVWGMWELKKRKPKLAFWMTIGITGAYAALAVHNHGVNR